MWLVSTTLFPMLKIGAMYHVLSRYISIASILLLCYCKIETLYFRITFFMTDSKLITLEVNIADQFEGVAPYPVSHLLRAACPKAHLCKHPALYCLRHHQAEIL